VELYISNPDMLWTNEYPTPRLGQGAFAACIRTLYKEVRGDTSATLFRIFGMDWMHGSTTSPSTQASRSAPAQADSVRRPAQLHMLCVPLESCFAVPVRNCDTVLPPPCGR